MLESTFDLHDRRLPAYQSLSHFNDQQVPPDGIVVNVGGGFLQIFEQQLRTTRPDILIITIDPSTVSHRVRYSGEGRPDTISNFFLDATERQQRRQILSHTSAGKTLAALGKALPLKSNFADTILDVYAASYYSPSENEFLKYLQEAYRILKPGGFFHSSTVRVRAHYYSANLIASTLVQIGFQVTETFQTSGDHIGFVAQKV